VLVGKPVGKRLLCRPRHQFEDSRKMNLKELSWEGIDWIYLAEDRDKWRPLVNMEMNFRVTQNSEKLRNYQFLKKFFFMFC